MKPRATLVNQLLTLETLVDTRQPQRVTQCGNKEYYDDRAIVGYDSDGLPIVAALHVFSPTQERPKGANQ